MREICRWKKLICFDVIPRRAKPDVGIPLSLIPVAIGRGFFDYLLLQIRLSATAQNDTLSMLDCHKSPCNDKFFQSKFLLS